MESVDTRESMGKKNKTAHGERPIGASAAILKFRKCERPTGATLASPHMAEHSTGGDRTTHPPHVRFKGIGRRKIRRRTT